MEYKDSTKSSTTSFGGSFFSQQYDFTDLLIKTKIAQALEEGVSKFPVYRYLGYAARTDIHSLFDSLAFDLGMKASRLEHRTLFLTSDQAFVSANGLTQSDYCSFRFQIWADSVEEAMKLRHRIIETAGDSRITMPMFTLDWHFLTQQGLQSASIEELANDQLFDEAYPDIKEGLADFIESYLDSNEPILVLQGPPGTGKTRLIRKILGSIDRRSRSRTSILFTSDQKALERDEIFVRFLTGWHDAFVFEDADEILKPRADGNFNLHRFLTIADGVVRAQARKIIFSTNLPNLHDLDEALVRPGRCFRRLFVRELTGEEALILARRLSADGEVSVDQIINRFELRKGPTHSVADIYKLVNSRD
ncbi:MAG: ATP-binding protein [Gammaproteobacteria bacterium]|nr:ATP-binding protein [Gammaproteobacteria bacterium]